MAITLDNSDHQLAIDYEEVTVSRLSLIHILGMDDFLELADAKKIYPMHCWEDYTVIDRWLWEHPDSPYRERIVKITARGQMFEQ